MPDVFLSYSRDDKPRAEAIAKALEAQGYEVFWDNEIPPGSTWADYLQSKITNAKALVVLWTAASTASQWVREEARIGRDAKKLVPIILDGAVPPFGFGEVQAVDLSHWTGKLDDHDWQRFLKGLGYVIEQSGGATPAPRATPRAVAMPLAPGLATAGAPPVAAPANGGFPKWVTYAGLAAIAFIGLGVIGMFLPDSNAPPQPQSYVAPSGAPNAAVAAAIPPQAKAVAERARAAQAKAKGILVNVRNDATAGQQAFNAAAQGAPGLTRIENAAGVMGGNLQSLVQNMPAAIGINQADGIQFVGMRTGADDANYIQSGRWLLGGGAVFEGRFQVVNGAAFAEGIIRVPNKYILEGNQRGQADSTEGASGEAVVTYANGERYEGEYRAVGEGAAGTVFRNGLGVYYAANGSLINAGRFDNDRYVGPN